MFRGIIRSDPLQHPKMKPNKPWKDRKRKQILEGKLLDAELEVDNKVEIARWQRKEREEEK